MASCHPPRSREHSLTLWVPRRAGDRTSVGLARCTRLLAHTPGVWWGPGSGQVVVGLAESLSPFCETSQLSQLQLTPVSCWGLTPFTRVPRSWAGWAGCARPGQGSQRWGASGLGTAALWWWGGARFPCLREDNPHPPCGSQSCPGPGKMHQHPAHGRPAGDPQGFHWLPHPWGN